MTTNVWLSQEWLDLGLAWDEDKYGGVDVQYVPSEDIWLPDIVLYNNADGNYQVTLMTKATVYSSGKVVWEPPAIYKSSCNIDVEFFPFDEQTCEMKFSSWTYDGALVDLKHQDQADVQGEVDIAMAIDLSGYYRSFIWDVMKVPARRNEVYYPCCPEFYPDVTFKIQIKRKTLFYTVNLIIPCVAISFLTVMVFYLPSDSGEKITLCISILLSLTVFFLLLADLIPPTSLVVPLIGKYLMFTMILVTLSIIITVVVLNIHNRTPATHTMAPWVRWLFLHILPRMLFMKRPMISSQNVLNRKKTLKVNQRLNGLRQTIGQPKEAEALLKSATCKQNGGIKTDGEQTTQLRTMEAERRQLPFSPELVRAMEGVKFIAEHLKEEDQDDQILEDWKYVAMVVDRLFLWLFTTACVVGTFGIILQAPSLYDKTKPMDVGIE
ncbi:acetylcholine receptor subunit beta-like 2 [Watersipora subatra]|uniref:acetylcholine receptor subunit beta-like 2 n=1 Tax=Watersipora subatra TaxID=2589382 RepID=UPI00355B4164